MFDTLFYVAELFRRMVNIRMDGWVTVRMGVCVYVCDVCVVGLASFLFYDKRVGPTWREKNGLRRTRNSPIVPKLE